MLEYPCPHSPLHLTSHAHEVKAPPTIRTIPFRFPTLPCFPLPSFSEHAAVYPRTAVSYNSCILRQLMQGGKEPDDQIYSMKCVHTS